MTNRFRTSLSLESLDARAMLSATPVASAAGLLTAPVAYSSTTPSPFGATTQDGFAPSDFLADDIEFSAAQRVESFAIRYRAEVPVDAVVTFHSVDPVTGGPGAEVASFLLENLPAGNIVNRSVTLPEAARFTWEPTAGIYKNSNNGIWGAGVTGGFLSVRFERLDGTPYESPTGGQISAIPSGQTFLNNQANGTGTLSGVWDVPSSTYVGGRDYQAHSMSLQVGMKPVGAAPVNATQLVSFTLSADFVRGGQSSTGTIVLSAPAPAGGTFIRLTSNSAAVSAPVVFVPAGATSVTFTLSTARVTADTLATITATLGDITLSDQFAVTRRR